MQTTSLLLVMSGPSGVGKSTIFKNLQSMIPNLHFSISCTTRAPREGENHGEHYYFLTLEEFKKHLDQDDFIEYAEVHGNYYGTLKSEVHKQFENGNHVILDIDVQGQRLVRQAIKNTELDKATTFIFIAPPSFETLRSRLYHRATDSQEVIERRLNNALKELQAYPEYDYVVVNDDLATAVQQLYSIFTATTCKTTLNHLSFSE